MAVFVDQMGNNVKLDRVPQRIVSLVPSQSELLWDLGSKSELVGITKFCIHPPEMFKSVTRVGGTKKLNIQKIRQLGPDLIIGNKEENSIEQIKVLQEEYPVWMSDIVTIDDALQMIRSVGEITGRNEKVTRMTAQIKEALKQVKGIFNGQRVAYLIWNDPVMLAASDTFIHEMMVHVGLVNVASGLGRYPEMTIDQLRSLEPDLIFLSSEPYPFKEKHAAEFGRFLPDTKILLVDGEMFSWYGSRLLHVPEYVKDLHERVY